MRGPLSPRAIPPQPSMSSSLTNSRDRKNANLRSQVWLSRENAKCESRFQKHCHLLTFLCMSQIAYVHSGLGRVTEILAKRAHNKSQTGIGAHNGLVSSIRSQTVPSPRRLMQAHAGKPQVRSLGRPCASDYRHASFIDCALYKWLRQ